MKNKINVLLLPHSIIDEHFIDSNFSNIDTFFQDKYNLSLCDKYKKEIFAQGYLLWSLFRKTKNIYQDENGRISLNSDDVKISFSNTADYTTLCLHKDFVGIDIEKNVSTQYEKIINRLFNDSEKGIISLKKNKKYQIKIFYLIWSSKEALFKTIPNQKNVSLNDLIISNSNKQYFSDIKGIRYYFCYKKYKNHLITVCSTKSNLKIVINKIKY